ncbi:hypothetical protein ACHAPO_011666 [Fusarium lateritium]
MSRRLVHSFLLATALSPLVNAGPCRPHSISSSSGTEGLTQALSSTTVASSSLNPSDTSQSATASEDAVTSIETSSIVPTDTTLSFSATYSVSIATEIILSSATDISSTIDTDNTSTLSEVEPTIATLTDTTVTSNEEETSTATLSEAISTFETSGSTGTTKATDTTTMTSGDVTTTEASSTAPATSTEAAHACTPTMVYPKPADAVCGRQGNPESATNLIATRGGEATESIWNCYKACKDTPECGSVIFNRNIYCELWKGKPGETNNLESDWRWWDMDCFTCLPDETQTTPPTQPEPTCIDNLINPPPEGRVCGEMGDSTGLFYNGPGPDGSSKSLQACAKACKDGQCSGFKFEAGQECEFYVGGGMTIGQKITTSYKWYDQDCFCDLEKPADNEDVCVDESPKTKVCGIEGQPKNTCIEDITPFAPSSIISLEACQNLCKDNDCDSIAFKKDEWCSIFKGQIGGASDEIDVPGREMWDMACFDE